ncbi:MAG: APC family permease [Thermotogae bacterium]|nr:APC family permease [Thermotogota bacterium]
MKRERKLGLWEAVAIGIGGMVGGGIFAVLGLTLSLAGGGAPLSFLIAGVVALLTAHSYAKLSVRYPSEGGTVEFLVRAFGNNLLTSYLNTLLLASYVIMLALYSYAFGAYASALIAGTDNPVLMKILIVAVLAAFGIINALGAYLSGKVEDVMVALKVGILLFFSIVGLLSGDFSRLSPEQWKGLVEIMTGGLIIFLAYEGFELIANTSQDVRHPEETLPKAYYISVSFVIFLYVLVAITAVINLTPEEVMKYRDYALAVAARPALGEAGFILIGIAAVLSTASAINATLYGSSRISYLIAKFGALPRTLSRRVWKDATEGLVAIVVISALFATLSDLSNISVAGSMGFLVIFTAVNLAHFRLRRETGSGPVLPLVSTLASASATVVLLLYNLQHSPQSLRNAAIVFGATFVFEVLYRSITGLKLKPFVDWKLQEIEEFRRRPERHLREVVRRLKEMFPDAEIYVVGRGPKDGWRTSPHINLLVLTDSPPDDEEEAERELKRSINLRRHHPLHIKFRRKEGAKPEGERLA